MSRDREWRDRFPEHAVDHEDWLHDSRTDATRLAPGKRPLTTGLSASTPADQLVARLAVLREMLRAAEHSLASLAMAITERDHGLACTAAVRAERCLAAIDVQLAYMRSRGDQPSGHAAEIMDLTGRRAILVARAATLLPHAPEPDASYAATLEKAVFSPHVDPDGLSMVLQGRDERARSWATRVTLDDRREMDQEVDANSERPWLSLVASAQRTPGTPLPDEFRAAIERTTGRDVSHVRVHTGPESEAAALGLDAEAFTIGSDIHLPAASYSPESPSGRYLVAHETAHAIQQRGSPGPPHALALSQPGDESETEADRVAQSVTGPGDALPGPCAPPESLVSPGSAQRHVARKERGIARQGYAKEIDQGFNEHAPARVEIRFKGVRIDALGRGYPIDPRDLPEAAYLVRHLARLRARQPGLAVAALASVRGRPEMRLLRSSSSKAGDFVELPASYLRSPPTAEMAMFIAVDAAISYLSWCIDLQSAGVANRTPGQRDVGGYPVEATPAAMERLRARRYATGMVTALTGTFGGLVGVLAASAITDDGETVAEAGALGETVTDMLGAHALLGPRGERADRGVATKRNARAPNSAVEGEGATQAPEGSAVRRRQRGDSDHEYRYDALHPGPLTDPNNVRGSLASGFFGGKYDEVVLDTDRIYYRVATAKEAAGGPTRLGRWYTESPPLSDMQLQIDSAVKPIWRNPRGEVTGVSPPEVVMTIRVPKGTRIYLGPVAPQGHAHLGGNDKMQVCIPDIRSTEGVEILATATFQRHGHRQPAPSQ